MKRMRAVGSRRAIWAHPAAWPVAVALLLAVYLATPNRQYHLDALDYAAAARSGLGLFHPHHLLYNAFGHLLMHWLSLVCHVEALVALTVANALITICAIVLLARLARELTGNREVAIVIALLYGVTHGIWHMATAVECYPMALLAELAALTLVAQRSWPALPTVLLAGVASAIAMLFHQTAIFSVPAVSLILGRRSPRWSLLYLAVAGTLTAGAYVACARAEHLSISLLPMWITSYAHSQQFAQGTWGGGLHLTKLLLGVVGLVLAVVFPNFAENLRGFSPYRPGAGDLLPLAAIAVALGLLVGVWRRARQPAPRDVWTAALWTWVGLHAAFTLWWESTNYEFWLLLLPPLALLLARTLRSLDLTAAPVGRRVLLATVLLFCGNLLTSFAPATRLDDNGWLAIVRTLDAVGLTDQDLILSEEPAVRSYAHYFLNKQPRCTSIEWVAHEPAARERFRAEIADAIAHHRAYLLETEVRAHDPAFYAPFLAHSEPVGTYAAYGHHWTLYRLR